MFFIIPIGVQYRAERYPVVTFTLMGLNTVIYLIGLIYCWDDADHQRWWFDTFWLIPSQSLWHTYLTAMFVHGGFFHLLGNMIYLFLFGSCVEDLIGKWRYLSFYLAGGLIANLAYIALIPEHFEATIPMGGASGAISACMGGFVLLLHKTKIEFKWVIYFFFRLFSGEFQLPAWLVLSFWFLMDVAGALIGYSLGGGTHGGTAFGAHVGGFVAGMIMVAALKPLLRREAARAEAGEEDSSSTESQSESASENDAVEIYLLDGQNQLGPFTTHQVRQMIQLGSVSAETEFWRDGMEGWAKIREFGG